MKLSTKQKKWGTKQWKNEAWKWFSIYVRLFYCENNGYLYCYTCKKRMFWKGEGCQCGHFQAGRGNSVLLDFKGVRPQCDGCNVWRYGEQYIFGKNLEKEVGEKKVMELKRKKHQTKKVSKKDWEEKAMHYQLKAVKLAVKKNLEI